MSDIVDFIFMKSQSFIGNIKVQSKIRPKKLSSHEIRKIPSTNSPDLQRIPIKINKYAQISSIYSILMKIFDQDHMVRLVFKLQKNTEMLRIHNNFLRNYVFSLYSKQNQLPFQIKINPLTGQIFLSISYLKYDCQQKQIIQQIQFFTKIASFKKRIIKFWENIISLTQGDFGVEDNDVAMRKANQILILALMAYRENQSENVYNFKTSLSNPQQKELGLISDLKCALPLRNHQQNHSEEFPYRRCLIQVFKQKKKLEQDSIRPLTTFSNLQVLNISKKDKEGLFTKIRSLQREQILKVDDQRFGKIFLNAIISQKQTLQKIVYNLNQMNKTNEITFLNYYFLLKDGGRQQLLKMALKKCSLKQYILKNANCLSFSKKINIFMNAFEILHEIWDKFQMFPGLFNIADFSITKTQILKFQKIQKWVKMEDIEEFQLSQERRYFYKTQMMTRIQNIFNIIFFNSNIVKPRISTKRQFKFTLPNHEILENQRIIVNQKSNQLHYYGIPQILSPIMHSLQKYETEYNNKGNQEQQKQNFLDFGFCSNKKYKKGNLDLILGSLIKSIELLKIIC